MTGLSRRALLRASSTALAPALLTAPGLAASAVTTPIMRLFHQWEAAHAFFNGPQGKAIMNEDEYAERWEAEVRPIEAAAELEPATDLPDMAVKVLILSGEGSWGLPRAVILECAVLAGRELGKLPRHLFTDEASAKAT